MGTRVKTFDSTGLPTAGKLYAGDLNAIQDDYADLSNASQVLRLGTLEVVNAAIALIKFGTAEARLTAAMRIDGIVRALGGVFAGTFTTTQRDAIAAGSRPFGLVILNTTTNRLEQNMGSDATPVWLPLGQGEIAYQEATAQVQITGSGSPTQIVA